MNQLSLNEQFALRAQFQTLNFLSPQIAEFASGFHVETVQTLSAKQIQTALKVQKITAKSLFTVGCPFCFSPEITTLYTENAQKIQIENQIFDTKPNWPYGDLPEFQTNENLFSLVLILYQSASAHQHDISVLRAIQIVQQACSANNVLLSLSHSEQILKVFLSTVQQLKIAFSPHEIYWQQAIDNAYFNLLSKKEFNVLPILIPQKTNLRAPPLPYSCYCQFDFYFSLQLSNFENFENLKEIIQEVLSLFSISNLVLSDYENETCYFQVQYKSDFIPFQIFKGPLVTEKVAVQKFKLLFGQKAEFRRFQNGEMRICTIFEEFESKDLFVESLLRYISTIHSDTKSYQCFHSQKLERHVESKYDFQLTETLSTFKYYLSQINQNHNFPFTVFDITINQTNDINLNGFISVTGFGNWYWTPAANQLLKALILQKLTNLLPKQHGIQLQNHNTHLEAQLLTSQNTLITVRLLCLTDADQIIQKSLSVSKFDYLYKLQRSIIQHSQLTNTLIQQYPSYSQAIQLAKQFLQMQLIPTYSFQPALIDYLGVFNSPQMIQLIERFQRIASEQNTSFEELLTEENLLENDLKNIVNQATKVVDFQVQKSPYQSICCENMISNELIEMICAIPFSENSKLKDTENHIFSSLSLFRHFLKFFAYNQERKFEINVKLDDIMEIPKYLKIAVKGDEEGTMFSNISEQLFKRLSILCQIALNSLDQMLFDQKFKSIALFKPNVQDLSFVLLINDNISKQNKDLFYLESSAVQQLQIQHAQYLPLSNLNPEFLRQIIPNIIKISTPFYEVQYLKNQFLGFKKLKNFTEFRIQDLPDDIQFYKAEGEIAKFDEQRFIEEVLIESGGIFSCVYVNKQLQSKIENCEYQEDLGGVNFAVLQYMERNGKECGEELWETEEEDYNGETEIREV
ncbi:Nrap family protein [Spironucleus salmonicida]|uniref:Nrap family protein n=1 Tax=Spironucleus salmonicida TaxID=348837 RepID=V6M083_9EUKA|nr:Nrap family protein [Spironucleus salmonicida]|eukprot:EST46539.1 Nrap family protein [Spironucleus salmonicida]